MQNILTISVFHRKISLSVILIITCLTNIFLNFLEFNNPTEIQKCAKLGDSYISPCDHLRMVERVIECTLCEYDFCNPVRGVYNAANFKRPFSVTTGIIALLIVTLHLIRS